MNLYKSMQISYKYINKMGQIIFSYNNYITLCKIGLLIFIIINLKVIFIAF